jgi:hypothetical protein
MEILATLPQVMMEILTKLLQATMGTRVILPHHPIRPMTAGEDDAIITTRSAATAIGGTDTDTITEGIEGMMLLLTPSCLPLNHLPPGHLQLMAAVTIEDTMYAVIAIVNMDMMIHLPLRPQEITVDATGPIEDVIPEMRRKRDIATVTTTERATKDIITNIITTATMERKSFRSGLFRLIITS